MSAPIRFGLIGVGGIGAYHLRSIQALERTGVAKLVAVADPMLARFPELEQTLPAAGVRCHLDYRDLLNEEMDAVTIATPIPFHEDMAKACIERGWFVNLEKPPVPLVQQLEELIRLDHAQRVSVGFQMVGSQCVQTLKALVADGKLGAVRSIRAAGCWPRLDHYYQRASWAGRMTLGGHAVFDGPATNALAHLIHNIMFLAGEGPTGFAVPEVVEGEVYRAREIESYDLAALRGKFSDGVEFSAVLTHATEESLPFRLEVQGSEGWARLSEDGARLVTSLGDELEKAESTQELLDHNYDQFVTAIGDGSHAFPTRLADTRGYVKTTNAMLLSSGGIHAVAAASIRTYGEAENRGYDVEGLRADVEASLQTGRLPSEWGRPWAIAKPRAIALADLTSLPLGELG